MKHVGGGAESLQESLGVVADWTGTDNECQALVLSSSITTPHGVVTVIYFNTVYMMITKKHLSTILRS